MRIVAPNWVSHGKGAPIFSVHIHPDGNRLATAGQAEEGARGMLAIWNYEPIRQKDKFENQSCPKLLAKLPHDAVLNCARWSPDGRLAVCSDDQTIMVYEYCGRVNTAGTIGSKEFNIEKYKRTHTLRGHTNSFQVLQVEWSPDGRYLASCSLDGSIIVWKAAKLNEQVVVLDASRDGHSQGVKGISWDPVGRYLASQSQDKSLRIWLVDEWKKEGLLLKPFDHSAQTTMFTRGSWTPDGQYYLAPSAMNNGGPTVEVVKRSQWDTHCNDLVGHRKATTCVSVCPQMVTYETKSGKTVTASIVAVGGREGNISIWLVPQVVRPLCLLDHVFNNTVSDMSWDGLELTISSICGRVLLVQFDDDEFGKPVTNEDMIHICEKLYQKVPIQYREADRLRQNGYVCRQSQSSELDLSFTEFDPLVNGTPIKSNGVLNGHQTSPVKENGFVSPAEKKIAELMEQRKEQKEDRTEAGKRRIQPIFLSSSISEAEPVLPPKRPRITPSTSSSNNAGATSKPTISNVTKDANQTRTDSSAPSQATDRGKGGDQMCAGCSKQAQAPALTAEEKKQALESRRGKMMATALKKPEARAFELLKVKVVGEGAKEFEPVTKEETTLHVNNENPIATATLKVRARTVWQLNFPTGILLTASSRSWIALCCVDSTVTVVSLEGFEWLTVGLDSPCVRLCIDDKFLLALTQNGRIHSWNLSDRTCVMSQVDVFTCPFLSAHKQLPSISLLRASPIGSCLIAFQTGEVIAFSTKLASWLKLDVHPQLAKLFKGFPTEQLAKDAPIGAMLKNSIRSMPRDSVQPASHQTEASVSERQLEQWLNASLQLQSAGDFKAFAFCYIEQLINHKSSRKLDRFLKELSMNASACGVDAAAFRRSIDEAFPQISEFVQESNFF
ncbi:hypothetical protein WR25_25323 [Diploscapter pachys]|uniref:Protein HIRA n=1 Tax=Diploscapter pachys TaxID=2018661 RepID=A0A2A2JER2_9BILA|nr:hypothetical protein WR25_25323 [Diploscapter pachys]